MSANRFEFKKINKPEELKKVPLYQATRSLKEKFTFESKYEDATTTLNSAKIHAVLYCGFEGLLKTKKEMTFKNGNPVYKEESKKKGKKVEDANLATAAATLLYTDTCTEEGYLSDKIEEQILYFSAKEQSPVLYCQDLYTKKIKQQGVCNSKATRDADFNRLLNERVKGFSAIASSYDYDVTKVVATTTALDNVIKDSMFHETFHHSEQAAMHYLSSVAGLKYLVKQAQEGKAKYVYGIKLDIFTDRMLCCNCNSCLLGMQNTHNEGFLYNFSQELKKEGIQSRSDNMVMSVHVSAKRAPKLANLESLRLPNDQGIVHEYNPECPRVLQAENKALGIEKILKDEKLTFASYKGSFFSSTDFKFKLLNNEVIKLRK